VQQRNWIVKHGLTSLGISWHPKSQLCYSWEILTTTNMLNFRRPKQSRPQNVTYRPCCWTTCQQTVHTTRFHLTEQTVANKQRTPSQQPVQLQSGKLLSCGLQRRWGQKWTEGAVISFPWRRQRTSWNPADLLNKRKYMNMPLINTVIKSTIWAYEFFSSKHIKY